MRRYDEGDISILVTSGHFYFGTTVPIIGLAEINWADLFLCIGEGKRSRRDPDELTLNRFLPRPDLRARRLRRAL